MLPTDLNLDRGPEPKFILMDERRVGNEYYDEVVMCINVDLPQHWMRAVVTAREQVRGHVSHLYFFFNITHCNACILCTNPLVYYYGNRMCRI